MAFGDLIATLQLPEDSPVEEGCGLTVNSDQLAIGSFTNISNQVGFYDINNNLSYLSVIDTDQTYESIQYDANENVYWGLANHIPQPFPQPLLQRVFKFQPDGTTILDFDVHDNIPVADQFNPTNWEFETANAISLTPDGSEIWVSYYRAFRIYRYDTSGNYQGFFDIPPENETITGMSTDGTNMWFVTSDFSSPPNITISKRDASATVLESVTVQIPEPSAESICDIEFDAENFLPLCALWVRGYSGDVGNFEQYAYVYEVPCPSSPCEEPPVINAENLCLPVGAAFDPLANVSATDCDGSDIPLTPANVIFNDVDTSTPGMYTVTYQITSPLNGLTTEKTIYVGIYEVTPRIQAITDLIKSVALEQTSLAHILNAEGEKIQKAVALNLTNAEMAKINKSVKDMADTITKLEMVLHGKLGLFSDCLCGPECNFPG